MKSFSASEYVDDADRSTGVVVHPASFARTTETTRLPGGRLRTYVKHRPDTEGNRLCAPVTKTPFSSWSYSWTTVIWSVKTMFLNGSTVSTEPREMTNGGGV